MKKDNDILQNGKNPYGVPDGYFESLRKRLDSIPCESVGEAGIGLWTRFRPYAALAACFVAAFLVGNAVLRNTAGDIRSSDQIYYEFLTSEVMAGTGPEDIYRIGQVDSAESETLSDEDVINYLLATGAQPEHIEYVRLAVLK